MEAPAPQATWSGRHAVEVYVRTYSTMLQSSGEIRVESLEQAHIGMESALHALAGDARVDMGALIYSARRLPSAIARSRRVLLSQSPEGFRSALGVDVLSWQQVEAPARRRRWYYDGDGTLAVLLASHSDIDDLVPSLVAYQLEWNKMHRVLVDAELDPERARRTVEASEADWARLREAWAPNFEATLAAVRRAECHITLRMVGGTHVGYSRAFHRWWAPVAACLEELGLSEAPIYFVSSNLHSLINVLSGVARRFENEIHDFVRSDDPDLYNELRKLEAGQSRGSRDNWLYFAARRIFDHHQRAEEFRQRRVEFENEVGIRHVSARAGVDSSAQIFKLQDLDPTCFDARIGSVDPLALKASQGAILNVDYPLGLGAYHMLRDVAEQVGRVAGIYVMGKAATLNADVGDVMIANVVYNEHSGNTYWLDNCFAADAVQPHLVYGSAVDNQRAVTVRGTFLQNREYLEFYYQGRYTVIEMEAGPYLDACFETSQPGRYPMGENINMTRLGFDLGIIHYASDTPYTQARTLGARGLSYRGMDSTYASAIAVARQILRQEQVLLS